MRPLPLLLAIAATASPAAAWDAPEEVVGTYALAAIGENAAAARCELELIAPMAHEFEGVWYVARPLHYEDNREACRHLGLDDVIAWSGARDSTLWVLAEGAAGFMEFARADDCWRLIKSGHNEKPDLVLTRTGDVH